MYEKASRYDVLAKEFCRCPYCGAEFPHISIRGVEPKTRGTIRKKHYFLIRATCTHPNNSRCRSEYSGGRDFSVEVPAYQYWETLDRHGVR